MINQIGVELKNMYNCTQKKKSLKNSVLHE